MKRHTDKDLFIAIMRLVKENGHFDKAEAIMDYVSPSEDEFASVGERPNISNYEFDFQAIVSFGGSEGIYIDCYLSGMYTEDDRWKQNPQLHIGTIKTLNRDLASMKAMGELCGALTYYCNQFVKENLNDFTPKNECEIQ